MNAIPPSQIAHAIDFAKSKGVKAIKVEFEALVEPVGCPEVEGLPCPAHGCRWGQVPVPCSSCDGAGKTRRDGPCQNCEGSGSSGDEEQCEDCNGHGRIPAPNEERANDYIDRFARMFRRVVKHECLAPGERYRDLVLFARPYADLSVGTELTLTIPVDRVPVLPHLVAAFCTTCAQFGNDPARAEQAIGGAGMHLTLLWNKNYPTRRKLPGKALDSFRTNAGKLMLAMIYLGSARSQTRSLDYRVAIVFAEDGWIDLHDGTCMEFRVFDPCYDEPTRILEYFLCVARLLNYFAPSSDQRVTLEAFDLPNLSRVGGPFDYRGRIALEKFFSSAGVRERLIQEIAYFTEEPFGTPRAREAADIIRRWPQESGVRTAEAVSDTATAPGIAGEGDA